jgi:hypothetical protein
MGLKRYQMAAAPVVADFNDAPSFARFLAGC